MELWVLPTPTLRGALLVLRSRYPRTPLPEEEEEAPVSLNADQCQAAVAECHAIVAPISWPNNS